MSIVTARDGGNVQLALADGGSLPAYLLPGSLTPGALTPGSPQPAALQGTLNVDPRNVTGHASPNGPGTAAQPFDRFSSLWNAWGTNAPNLNTPTNVVFLSDSPADGSDPVIYAPVLTGTATLGQVSGTRTVVGSGALSAVVPKSTVGAGSKLTATLTAGLAVGDRVINTTKGSMAILNANAGGNSWALSQPIVLTPPPHFRQPGQDNTWANGDAFQVVRQTNVDICLLNPTVCDLNAAFDNVFAVYSLNVLDTSAAGLGSCQVLSPYVSWYECGLNRAIIEVTFAPNLYTGYYNCDFVGSPWLRGAEIWGGQCRGGGIVNTEGRIFDNFIASASVTFNGNLGCALAEIMLDGAGVQLTVRGQLLRTQAEPGGGANPVIYGTGNIEISEAARLVYSTVSAVAQFQATGGISINHFADALNGSATALPSLSAALTAANLDNAAVFNGNAWVPGFGSIGNS